jgi:hypothetical protein
MATLSILSILRKKVSVTLSNLKEITLMFQAKADRALQDIFKIIIFNHYSNLI